MGTAVTNFTKFYESLGAKTPVELDKVYSPDIEFIDPVHRMLGIDALDQYFNALMVNVDTLSFRITETSELENQAFLQWIMSYQHPRLANGQTIDVAGISHIRFDTLITYHRDYYDLGEMIYEHVPVYGWLTRKLKARLAA